VTSMTHRNRIVASSLLLLLSALVIFGIYGYANMNEIRSASENFRKNYLVGQLEYNALSVLKQINTYAAHLKTQEYTSYSSGFLGLGTTAEKEKALRNLHEKINRLHIDGDLVQSLYILGADDRQLNYARTFELPNPDAAELPRIEDLNGTGIMEALTVKGTGFPVYIQEGELQQLVQRKWSYVSNRQLRRVSDFVAMLEGKWIISNGVNDYTLGLLVLKDDFPQQFLYAYDRNSHRLSVYTDRGIGTWGERYDTLDAIGQSDSREQLTSWVRRTGEKGQVHYIKQLAPYGIVLVWTEDKTGWHTDFNRTMKAMGVAFVLLLVGSLMLSLVLAKGILSPLHKLTRFIRTQGGLLPLAAYRKDSSAGKSAGKLLTATSIRTKLVVLFLLTVLVPLLGMVALFVTMQSQYAKQEWTRTAEALTKQMAWTVSKQAEVYEGAANALAANDVLSAYLTTSTGSFSSASASVLSGRSATIYPESKEFAYFVLYDTNGSAKYSTIFSNNLSLFYLDPQTEEEEGNWPDIAWLPASPDIYNHSAGQMIKRVYLTDQDERGASIGFLQLVLKTDAFQSIAQQGGFAFRIEDVSGNLMFQSQGYEERDMLSEAVPQSPNGRGSSLVLTEKIPGFDWQMTVRFPLDVGHGQSGELLWVVASVALLCILIGLILAQWLVRPIGLLRNAMDRVNSNHFEFSASGKARDEVSLLARHFNRMVEKINQLVEEDFRSKLREKELSALKAQAEMSMLQQQINPHFLYNTLESINMEAQRNNGETVNKMIGSLAKLFRYSIRSGPEQSVPLETEIEYTRYYMTVQENRFKERFAVEWSIDPRTLTCKVLKLILQPIVENAINHGLSEYVSGGVLHISSRSEGARLIITIADNGTGMRAAELESLKTKLREALKEETQPSSSSIQRGVGLSNVYRRLKIYYGDEADLLIDSKYMKGTTVTLIMPEVHDKAD